MAAYTTEIRTICEEVTGKKCGYNNADEVIHEAAPHIFSNYPIFDENYRATLNEKILRHYFFREICMETVGAWMFMLNTRMREIMPYFNKLYESERITFNPLWDIDRTTEIKGATSNSSARTGGRSTSRAKSMGESTDETVRETGSESGTKQDTGSLTESGSDNLTGTTTTSDKSASSRGSSNIAQRSEATSDKEASSSGETSSATSSENSSAKSASSSGSHDSGTESANESTRNASSASVSGSQNDTGKQSQWSLFSDTPQGGLGGALGSLTEDVLGGVSDDTNTYLTNATHNVSGNQNAQERSENNANASATDVDSENVRDDLRESSEASASDTRTESVSAQERENAYAGDKEHSGEFSGSETVSESAANASESSGTRTEEKTNERTATNQLNGSHSGTSAHDTVRSNIVDVAEAEKYDDEHNENVEHSGANAETQRVYGKSGGRTYSRMIAELRDSYLNVDMMIIDKLKDLFMCVY